jgi:hypothetical protein
MMSEVLSPRSITIGVAIATAMLAIDCSNGDDYKPESIASFTTWRRLRET